MFVDFLRQKFYSLLFIFFDVKILSRLSMCNSISRNERDIAYSYSFVAVIFFFFFFGSQTKICWAGYFRLFVEFFWWLRNCFNFHVIEFVSFWRSAVSVNWLVNAEWWLFCYLQFSQTFWAILVLNLTSIGGWKPQVCKFWKLCGNWHDEHKTFPKNYSSGLTPKNGDIHPRYLMPILKILDLTICNFNDLNIKIKICIFGNKSP